MLAGEEKDHVPYVMVITSAGLRGKEPVAVTVSAGAQAYLGARTGGVPLGDMMIDGVPRGAGVQPLSLSGPSSVGGAGGSACSGTGCTASGIGGQVASSAPAWRGVGSGDRRERVVAEGAQAVVAAAGEFAGHRQGRTLLADPAGDLLVVGVIRRGRPGGAPAGLIQRPAQQRGALSGQVTAGAFTVRGVHRDVQPGVAHGVAGVAEPNVICFRCRSTPPTIAMATSSSHLQEPPTRSLRNRSWCSHAEGPARCHLSRSHTPCRAARSDHYRNSRASSDKRKEKADKIHCQTFMSMKISNR